MRRLGDLCSLVISNLGIQRRDQHQRFMQQLRNALLIRRDPIYTMLHERATRVRQQSNRVQQVSDQHRFEYIQLEGTTCSCNGDGGLIPHDLSADHGHSFALRGIHFTWHDTRTTITVVTSWVGGYPGSFSGMEISPRPQRGPLER